MWFIWILFAIPLSILALLIIYLINRVYLRIEKENILFRKQMREKENDNEDLG